MNIKTALIAATTAALFASPAFALAASSQQDAATTARLTRAEVKAEVIRARAAGELDVTEASYPRELTATGPGLTRAQVRAEQLRARAAGELDVNEASAHYPSN